MNRRSIEILLGASMMLASAACVTMSPASRIEKQLKSLGVGDQRAECLAGELDDNLDRRDLKDVADFLEGLNRAQGPGQALDALLRIDNPRAAAAIASAGIVCAFGS
jgi:hypothetical protein